MSPSKAMPELGFQFSNLKILLKSKTASGVTLIIRIPNQFPVLAKLVP